MRISLVLLLVMFSLSGCSGSPIETGIQPMAAAAPAGSTQYVVQKGDYIVKIGADLGVPWESIFLANEQALSDRAEARCGKLSPGYTNSRKRKGHYCNERLTFNGKEMVGPNSLQPGDALVIPSAVASAAPTNITSAVDSIKGDSVVLVIDDTGSMSEDRRTVSTWYMAQIAGRGKRVVKVILYADGYVRELDPKGQIDMNTTGNMENTRSALETAASYKPDAIVLVTDEPGDDWNGFSGIESLPPVVAHSLDSTSNANLREVARRTGGTFVSGI